MVSRPELDSDTPIGSTGNRGVTVFDKVPAMEKLAYDMHVTSPLGHNVSVNSIYRNCLIVIQTREFLADLITLPF